MLVYSSSPLETDPASQHSIVLELLDLLITSAFASGGIGKHEALSEAVAGLKRCMLCGHAILCCPFFFHAMPCCAMLCHVVPCCAMLCHAVPCYAILCHAVPCCSYIYIYCCNWPWPRLQALTNAPGVRSGAQAAAYDCRWCYAVC